MLAPLLSSLLLSSLLLAACSSSDQMAGGPQRTEAAPTPIRASLPPGASPGSLPEGSGGDMLAEPIFTPSASLGALCLELFRVDRAIGLMMQAGASPGADGQASVEHFAEARDAWNRMEPLLSILPQGAQDLLRTAWNDLAAAMDAQRAGGGTAPSGAPASAPADPAAALDAWAAARAEAMTGIVC
jgi:hypothetical protein